MKAILANVIFIHKTQTLLILMLLAGLLCAQSQPADTIHYQTATEKYMQGKLKASIKHYNKAIKARPSDAIMLTDRGRSYALLGSFEKAYSDFTKAIAIDSTYARAYYNRAYVNYHTEDFEGAELDNSMAIFYDAGNKSAYINRGNARFKRTAFMDALDDYNTALKLDPTSALAHSNRGYLLLEMGKQQDALVDFDKALSIDSLYPAAWYNMALYHLKNNNYKQALLCLNKAIELQDKEVDFFLERMLVHYYLHDIKAAKSDYKKAGRLDSDIPIIEFNAAYSHEELTEELAKKYLQKADFRSRKQEHKQAIKLFTKAIELKKDRAEPYFHRGLSYIAIGKAKEGCTDLRKAESLGYKAASDEINNLCKSE